MTQTVPLIEELSSLTDGDWIRTPYFDWKIDTAADHLRLNARFRRCVQMVDDAMSSNDWRAFISLHLPQHREDAFFKILQDREIPHPLNNQLVGEIWTEPGILHSSSCFVLAGTRTDAPHNPSDLMIKSELQFLGGLPSTITAYRSHLDWNQLGPCWTLNEDVAEQFGIAYNWGVLTTIRVPRDCIVAYFGRRGESELIIQDHSQTEIVTERRIE